MHKAQNRLRETTKGVVVMCTRLHKGYIRLKCIIEQCCAKKNPNCNEECHHGMEKVSNSEYID